MPPRIADTQSVLDVFQRGLIRGSAQLPHDPARHYFYVEHPTEGWRVYLRSVCFIHELGTAHPFEANRFLVVKRTGADPAKASWEPPKGQMEGKDAAEAASLYELLRENVRREVAEEAKLYSLRDIQHMGKVLQSRESNYPPNTFFQYHIFSAYAYPGAIKKAFEEFEWIAQHPKAFARMRPERREKDALAWFDAAATRLMGRWSPALVKMYLGGS